MKLLFVLDERFVVSLSYSTILPFKPLVPSFEIVINIAFVNFLSTIPRRPPVSSLASNRRKKMSVALEAGLRHPKHNICLNNISKLACSFERLQHFRHESLSVWFDSRNHGWRGGFYRRISLERKRREDPRISRQTFRRSQGTMEDEIYEWRSRRSTRKGACDISELSRFPKRGN